MPGLSSGGFQVLEGDYSTWTKTALVDNPDNITTTANDSIRLLLNKSKTTLTFIADGYGTVYTYNISSGTLNAKITFTPTSGLAMLQSTIVSINGTYAVEVDGDNLRIFKNGVLQQTVGLVAQGITTKTATSGAMISWDGQYLAVWAKDTATGFYGWLILKGS